MNSVEPKSEPAVHSKSRIEHVVVDSEGSEVKDRSPFRLMDLPRELRDKVYRELLLPDKARGGRRPDGRRLIYAIQPAIIRVCKQTYRESSRILYEETKWILVTALENENGLISKIKNGFHYPFIAIQSPLYFPGTPVLRIDMSSMWEYHKYQASMLIPHQDFELHGSMCLIHGWTRIALRFDEYAMRTPATREALLHYCRDFRGIPSVTIEGLDPPTERAKLLDSMTTPIRWNEEYLERAKSYQQRAESQVAQGLFLDAVKTNYAGASYLRYYERRRVEGRLPGSDSHCKISFTEKEVDFHIACAYCLTKHGRHRSSRIFLDSILANHSKYPSPTKEQEIKIHYHKGLVFVAESDDIQALKEFRVVLSREPGHEGADAQVDTMEARLHKMPQIKRCELEAYLRDFVKQHRHREPGSAIVSEEEMPVIGLPDVLTLDWRDGASA